VYVTSAGSDSAWVTAGVQHSPYDGLDGVLCMVPHILERGMILSGGKLPDDGIDSIMGVAMVGAYHVPTLVMSLADYARAKLDKGTGKGLHLALKPEAKGTTDVAWSTGFSSDIPLTQTEPAIGVCPLEGQNHHKGNNEEHVLWSEAGACCTQSTEGPAVEMYEMGME
jgi:hypothetical protein